MPEKLIQSLSLPLALLALSLSADEGEHPWQFKLSPANELTLSIKAPADSKEREGKFIVSRGGRTESRSFYFRDGVATVELPKDLPYRAKDLLRGEGGFDYQVSVGGVIIGQGTMAYPRSTLKVTPDSALQAIEDARVRQDLMAIEYLNRTVERIERGQIDALSFDLTDEFVEFWGQVHKGDENKMVAEMLIGTEIVAQAAPILTLYKDEIVTLDARRLEAGPGAVKAIGHQLVSCLLEGAFDSLHQTDGISRSGLDSKQVASCKVIGLTRHVYPRKPSEIFYKPRLLVTTRDGRTYFCNNFSIYAQLDHDGNPEFSLSAPVG